MAAITFHSLRWKNFLSTGDQFIEVKLDKHNTNLVAGKNGSGKSTIIDALTFSLFGKSYRKINKPQLINYINNSDCVVEVEFTVGKTYYHVRRGIKPNLFEIFRNGEPVDQNASIGDYQKYLEDNILRMNYKSFTQIVILGSSNFVPFMQLTTGDRREIIDDLLDISIFSSMSSVAKTRLSEQKRIISDLDNELFMAEEKIAAQERYISGLQNKVTGIIDEKKEDIEGYEKKKQELQNNREDLVKRFDEVSQDNSEDQIKKLQKTQSKLEDYGKKFKTNKKKLGTEITFYKENSECSTCEQEISDDHRQAMIDKKEKRLREINQGETELQQELDKVMTQLQDLTKKTEELNDINRQIAAVDSEIDTMQENISRINEEIERLRQNDTDEIDRERKTLQEHEKEYERVQNQRAQEREHLFLLEEAVELLKDNGIKTKIIRQYLPVINKLINKYLHDLNFFVNLSLDENFKETIVSQFKDNFSYRSFSEGQKLRVDLSLLFTWVEIARMKNSVNTNLLFLDEIFDSSLDTEGIDDFMKLLDDAAKSKNVFVISHRSDQMVDRFDNIIQFELHKNFSRKTEDG